MAPQSGNATRLRVYTDGVLRPHSSSDCSGTIPASTTNSTSPVIVGNDSDLLRNLNATIDDVRIYNRVLSPDEIKRLYRIGSTFKVNVTRTDILRDGLVGHWTFDGPDMAGVIAYDRSGQGNHGTLLNDPIRTEGRVGQALKFNGINNVVNVPTNTSLDITSAITIAAWIYPTGTEFPFISRRSDCFSGVAQYQLHINPNRTINWNAGSPINGALTIDLNRWNFVAISYTASGQTGTLYINENSETITNAGTLPSASGRPVRIGDDDPCTGGNLHFYKGTLDELRLYNRALSHEEIKRLYNMGR